MGRNLDENLGENLGKNLDENLGWPWGVAPRTASHRALEACDRAQRARTTDRANPRVIVMPRSGGNFAKPSARSATAGPAA